MRLWKKLSSWRLRRCLKALPRTLTELNFAGMVAPYRARIEIGVSKGNSGEEVSDLLNQSILDLTAGA
jgi:hypothetical protein